MITCPNCGTQYSLKDVKGAAVEWIEERDPLVPADYDPTKPPLFGELHCACGVKVSIMEAMHR